MKDDETNDEDTFNQEKQKLFSFFFSLFLYYE